MSERVVPADTCPASAGEQQAEPAAPQAAAAAAAAAATVPASQQLLQDQQPHQQEQQQQGKQTEDGNQHQQQQDEQQGEQQPLQQQDRPKPKPGRKRKVAMHMAYLGAGYHGMQRNPGFPTIEAELESALVKMGAISEQNAGSFMKIHWMRAARTDKGVSAACQVVSAKLVVDPAEAFADRVNALLPKQIRVFGVQRATEGFDARKFCDKRKYEYILPAWAFDPQVGSTGRGPSTAALQAVAAAVLEAQAPAAAAEAEASSAGHPADTVSSEINGASNASGSAADGAADNTAADAADQPAAAAAGAEPAGKAVDDTGDDGGAQNVEWTADECASSSKYDQAKLERIRAEVAASKAQYKFGDAELQRLNSLLSQYEGTHNFHNYTVRVSATDPAARRFIRKFDASIVHISGEPWVKLVVIGQSFMLHQIRKMVGTALAVMRGVAAPECLQLALDPDRDVNTPMAPALGLFLDETYYDAFNKKFGHLHGDVTFEPFRAAAEQFKQQMLYPHISNTDAKELINALWLRQCNNTNYKFTKWGVWRPVRTIGAKAKAEAAARRAAKQQQGKRPAGAGEADDEAQAEAKPAAKQQRLERPGRLDGATAPMVVGMQETYGMSPHRDTERAAAARKELKEMRQEYDQFLHEQEQQMEQQQQQQQEEQKQPMNADEALDSLYDLM